MEETTWHALEAIVAVALCAVIAEFGQAGEERFATIPALPHGTPSHDTFGRVFAALDPVSAVASEARLVLAERAVRATASAVGAVPAVLHALALEGCIVTIDAIYNLALLQRIALTLLQHEPTARCGITATCLTAGGEPRSVLQVLARRCSCDCPGRCRAASSHGTVQ